MPPYAFKGPLKPLFGANSEALMAVDNELIDTQAELFEVQL
jgi:hypothetical protein